MRILGFGTYDLTKHPRVGIILDGLRTHGNDVIEVDEPLGFSTAERVTMLAKPWLSYRLLLRLFSRWARLVRGSTRARRQGRIDAILVGYLGHFDVILARLLFPRTRIALDLMIFAGDTARDRGATGALKLRALDALDRLASRCASLVVVDTDEQLELLDSTHRDKAVVVPVGSPQTWFDAGAKAIPSDSGQLRVIFFGLFTPLQGARVIGETIALLAGRPDISFTMIGTGQDHDATRAAASTSQSTTWIDWVDMAELPALVAEHDVCLGVFGTSPKALRVVPNKVYQGAAAGCAIVTSDTAPQRRALDGAARFVPAGDPRALAQALRELADCQDAVTTLRHAAQAAASERFTPAAVASTLMPRLLGESSQIQRMN